MMIDPKTQSYKENYKLLIGSIVPRPIAFVSTRSPDGVLNLAPFSFFTAISSDPPTICFSPGRRGSDGAKKDTWTNIEATGEFVVNVVTEAMAVAMNETASELPPEMSEFEYAGFTPAASDIISAPRVAESPISMECKLVQIVELGNAGPGGAALVIGEVIRFHVADNLLENGRIDVGLLHPVARLAGTEYTTLGRRFSLERKPWPSDKHTQ
ncbi:MAG: flavin reductase family protein [Candidatus Marinimicrobia bacterium]|nr:flavin reductase family protein [Candidatus Neomarinimicrobiota bacterium]MCF7902812.1 flavin reductase family protein [Candidatus Neomarinimicrobiota bacterium]